MSKNFIEWNRAGRPFKNEQNRQKKQEFKETKDSKWTKAELSILAATKYAANIMLAIAVVQQWISDGKPKTEYAGVKPWIDIIKDSLSDKNEKELLPFIGE